MKQLFTLAFALALPAMAFAQGKQVPYSSTFYQDAEWTVINVAEGTKTWEDIEFRTSDAKDTPTARNTAMTGRIRQTTG